MDRRRYRWTLRIAAVLVGGVAMLLWATKPPPPTVLTITNQSRQPIARLRVTVGGQVSIFKDVAAGAEVTAPLPAEGEAPFVVEGRLADGALIHVKGPSAAGLNVIVQPAGAIALRQAGKG